MFYYVYIEIFLVWDLRQKNDAPIFSLKKMEDYVSAIVTNREEKYLVCSSGDGSLSTFNIPGKKMHVQVSINICCLLFYYAYTYI